MGKLKEVTIDGKRFVIVEHHMPGGGWRDEGMMLRRMEEEPKQDIRDYCRKHRVWAAKDYAEDAWYLYAARPILILVGIWRGPMMRKALSHDFIFPDIRYDLALIAPDGSMPLLEPKYRPDNVKHPKHFEVGHWYKCIAKTRPFYFNNEGRMDFVLDGKPHQYTRECVNNGIQGIGGFDKDQKTWVWNFEDFIEVQAPKNKSKKQVPHRGDPLFVWDDDTPDTIPAHVEYFHHFDGDAVIDFDWDVYGKPCSYWQHYRLFDPALVGIPRKDWPKEEA